jgi:hypothetical protein
MPQGSGDTPAVTRQDKRPVWGAHVGRIQRGLNEQTLHCALGEVDGDFIFVHRLRELERNPAAVDNHDALGGHVFFSAHTDTT